MVRRHVPLVRLLLWHLPSLRRLLVVWTELVHVSTGHHRSIHGQIIIITILSFASSTLWLLFLLHHH